MGVCSMSVGGKMIRLQLWDTAGQERFRTITSSYYRRANGVIVTYDITDRTSFDHVRQWLGEIEKYAAPGTKALIVGNKCDMSSKRVISFEGGRELADSLGLEFVETSARVAHNVEVAFAALVGQLVSSQKLGVSSERPALVDLTSTPHDTKACSC